MSNKKTAGCVISIAKLLIQIPLSYALTFLILKHINATDVMWLLFWIAAPLGFAFSVVMEVTQKYMKEE